MIPEFTYIRAKSIRDALPHLAGDGARIQAGGTDLLGCMRDNIFGVKSVVSISRLNDLKGIRKTAEGLRVGALVTLTEIAESPDINKFYPALTQGAGSAASPQLRNQGTFGGNLCQKPRCWYYRGEFHASEKEETAALRSRARIITTVSWEDRDVTLFTLLTRLRPSSHIVR